MILAPLRSHTGILARLAWHYSAMRMHHSSFSPVLVLLILALIYRQMGSDAEDAGSSRCR